MKENRIIIAGGRDFVNAPLLYRKMDTLTANLSDDSIEVVCGKARGADTLGEQWAISRGYAVKYFPADWDGLGRGAGHIRNRQMGDYATHLVAFWDGESKGTKGMIEYATKKGLKIRVVNTQ